MLGGCCYAARAFCLDPERAGLQMRARFCLVYLGYCCGANLVLPLHIRAPPHRHGLALQPPCPLLGSEVLNKREKRRDGGKRAARSNSNIAFHQQRVSPRCSGSDGQPPSPKLEHHAHFGPCSHRAEGRGAHRSHSPPAPRDVPSPHRG